MTNIIDKILDELPQDIKDKTNIDENLEKLKKTKKIDQNKLLNEIIKELNDTIDKINDNNEKQKLENIKKNLEEYKDSLKKLQAKIGMSPISKWEVIDITKNIEKNWLFWKDDEGFMWFIRWILKFLEKLFSFPSSNKKIAKTFEKLWYGNNVDTINNVIKKLSKIKVKKIDELVKLTPNFNTFLSTNKSVLSDLGINNLSNTEKEIAMKIIYNIKLNIDFLKNNKTWFIKQILSEKFHTWDNIIPFDKMTIQNALDKMFTHGISDFLRDYALPDKWIKLLKYENNSYPKKRN